MKSIKQTVILLTISVFTTQLSFAQWTEDADGIHPTTSGKLIGIGTATPTAPLDINNNILLGLNSPAYGVRIKINLPAYNGGWARGFYIANEDNTKSYFSLGVNGEATNGVTTMSYAWLGQNYNNPHISFLANGNIGVGTTTPTAGFQVDQTKRILGIYRIASQEIRSSFFDEKFTINNDGGGAEGFIYSGSRQGASFPFDEYGEFIVQACARSGYNNGISFVTGTGTAQTIKARILENGNVGIGTSTPKEKLDVMGGISSTRNVNEGGYIFLSNSLKTDPAVASTWGIYNMTGGYGNSLQFWGYSNTATLGPKLVIKDDGKVGIGTSNPDAILHVTGGALMSKGWNRTAVLEAPYPVLIFNSNNQKWAGIGYDYTSNFNIWYNASSNDVSNGMIALSVNNASGYVGIGTSTPTEKLTINGNIKAKKLIVTQNGWADYVFDKDYKLMHIDSLSSYIQTNRHLPEIPTTKDIQSYGVDVGNNQTLLLKKIEELTLYIIEQHKEMAAQRTEIEALKKKLK